MKEYQDLFYGILMGMTLAALISCVFKLNWSDQSQQCVQALDKPGHIIMQVKGQNLEVSHFTPDLKVQWVENEDKK